MPFEPRVKLGKVGNSFKITIPMEMIEDLKWKEGDTLRIGLENDDKLIIHREGIRK
jgi:AbrB family looped-hinge helix DNA binding protein